MFLACISNQFKDTVHLHRNVPFGEVSRCTIQLNVIIMLLSRVNLHSIVAWMSRNRRYIWSLSDGNGIRDYNHLVRKQTIQTGWVFAYKLSGCGFEDSCWHLYHSYFLFLCFWFLNFRQDSFLIVSKPNITLADFWKMVTLKNFTTACFFDQLLENPKKKL